MKASTPVILFGLLAGSTSAMAQSSAVQAPFGTLRREVAAIVGSSANPEGLMARVEVRWRRPLSRSTSRALSDAHLSFGVSPELTPSYTRLGVWAEFAPVSFLGVRAGVEPALYFGTFSSLISFSDIRAPFDRATLKARRDEATSGTALRAYARPVLRMKVGRVGTEMTAQVERWRSSAAGPFFYEPSRNTLVAAGGGTISCLSAAVLYDASARLGVGAVYDLTHVYAAAANRIQRAGALVTYAPRIRFPGLGRPTVSAVAGVYRQDPYRRNQVFAGLGLDFLLRKPAG